MKTIRSYLPSKVDPSICLDVLQLFGENRLRGLCQVKLLSSLISLILLAYFTKLSDILVPKLQICIKLYSDYYCRATRSETIKLSTFLDVHTFLSKQQTSTQHFS